MNVKKEIKILFFIFIIMIFSLLNMFNASVTNDLYSDYFIKQLVWYVIGFICFFVMFKINFKTVFKLSFFLYLFSILLLILVLIFGVEVNGAKAWFDFKFFSFQPSEFTKLSLALYLTYITNEYNKSNKINDFLFIVKLSILTLIPSILVFIEPDTGAIIFYLIILFVCLVNSKINKKWLLLILALVLVVLAAFSYLFFFQSDLLIDLIGTTFFYRVDRLINFGDNYQIVNALTLIGSSGLFGSGLYMSSLYVPEAPTDFIFAYNIGNFGLLGFSIVTLSYLILNIFLITNVKQATNKLLAYIFISLFIFQQLYNILMNIGLLPIMGIPLPFLSYGGTSLVIYFVFLSFYFKST